MRSHTLFYGSSYDRGLQHLLKMWPTIYEKFPDATLHICYGWNTFDAFFKDNPERQNWKKRMNDAMNLPGIVHHGRVGKKELKKIRQQCGIWVYPTDFQEINCITALECQSDGVVPVVMNFAALKETVQSGVKVDGDIWEVEDAKKYIDALLDLMGDEKRWKEESQKATSFAQEFSWKHIANRWSDVLKA